MLPAEGRCGVDIACYVGRLQWGRGLLPAEGGLVQTAAYRGRALQWGRGLLPAEGVVVGLRRASRCIGFNGAAGCYPRKAKYRILNVAALRPLQWGRGLLPAEG